MGTLWPAALAYSCKPLSYRSTPWGNGFSYNHYTPTAVAVNGQHFCCGLGYLQHWVKHPLALASKVLENLQL